MAIPNNSGTSRTYSEQEILKYVDIIIQRAPIYDYFKLSDFFADEFPPYIEIKQRMLGLDYIKFNTNVTYKLTNKGIEAKNTGGHFEFEKLQNFKKERLEQKEHYDFINSVTDAKTKWIIIIVTILTALISVLALNYQK